jgi:hypothetical protein
MRRIYNTPKTKGAPERGSVKSSNRTNDRERHFIVERAYAEQLNSRQTTRLMMMMNSSSSNSDKDAASNNCSSSSQFEDRPSTCSPPRPIHGRGDGATHPCTGTFNCNHPMTATTRLALNNNAYHDDDDDDHDKQQERCDEHPNHYNKTKKKLVFQSPRIKLDDAHVFPLLASQQSRTDHLQTVAGAHSQDPTVLTVHATDPVALRMGVLPRAGLLVTTLQLLNNTTNINNNLPDWMDVIANKFPNLEHFVFETCNEQNQSTVESNLSVAESPLDSLPDDELLVEIGKQHKELHGTTGMQLIHASVRVRRFYVLYRMPNLKSINGISTALQIQPKWQEPLLDREDDDEDAGDENEWEEITTTQCEHHTKGLDTASEIMTNAYTMLVVQNRRANPRSHAQKTPPHNKNVHAVSKFEYISPETDTVACQSWACLAMPNLLPQSSKLRLPFRKQPRQNDTKSNTKNAAKKEDGRFYLKPSVERVGENIAETNQNEEASTSTEETKTRQSPPRSDHVTRVADFTTSPMRLLPHSSSRRRELSGSVSPYGSKLPPPAAAAASKSSLTSPFPIQFRAARVVDSPAFGDAPRRPSLVLDASKPIRLARVHSSPSAILSSSSEQWTRSLARPPPCPSRRVSPPPVLMQPRKQRKKRGPKWRIKAAARSLSILDQHSDRSGSDNDDEDDECSDEEDDLTAEH